MEVEVEVEVPSVATLVGHVSKREWVCHLVDRLLLPVRVGEQHRSAVSSWLHLPNRHREPDS